jgi:hypothetical protein
MPHDGVMNIGRLSIYGVINTFSTGNFCQLVLNLVNSISLPVGLEFGQQYQRRPYCAAHSQQKENNGNLIECLSLTIIRDLFSVQFKLLTTHHDRI